MTTLYGIPNKQGEQRCQAVGGNAEGKVPTTAPARASESPGSNPAAGAEPMHEKIAALELQLAADTAKLAAMHADLHASMTRLDAELATAIAAIEQRKPEDAQ